jgi:hypothetical protein
LTWCSVGGALSKNAQVVETQGNKLHGVADEASSKATYNHRRYVDTSWNFDAKGDDGQERLDDECEEQDFEHAWDVFDCRTKTVTGVCVCIAWTGQFEQKLSDWKLGVSVPEADQTGDERNEKDFEKRVFLDDGYATERSCPDARCFDEQCTKNTTNGARKDEGCQLKELPI